MQLLTPGFGLIIWTLLAFLIVFFILILPVNINAALRHIDYEKGTYEGPGTKYLWFRIPLQVLFILWVYWFALR